MDEEPTPKPHIMPPKHVMPYDYTPGEIRIIKPADPEKLAALKAKRKEISRRRKAGGIKGNNRTEWGKY